MKKKKLTLIVVFLLSILFIQNVDAQSYSVRRTSRQQYSLSSSTTNLPVYLNLYQATVDGIAADTYCVDPGKSYAGDGSFVLDRYIEPYTSNPLDLALAGALKEINSLRSAGVGGDDIKLVGTIAMRWVFMKYGASSLVSGYKKGGELERDYNAFKNSDTAISVNGNVAIVQYAKQVFQAGVNAANAGTYLLAVSQGYIYSPNFKAVNYTVKSISGNKRTITFEIKPGDSSKAPSQLYIDAFQAGCSNTTVTCTVNTKSATYEPAGLLIEMTIDTTNWNNQDFGIYVDPAYCDANDAGMQILLLRKSSNANQRMLAVLPGNCPATYSSSSRKPVRTRIPVDSDSCECNYTSGTTWDGTYTVTEKSNGSKNTFTIKESDTDKVNRYNCPSPDTCRKKENFTCQKPSESTDGKYHCPSSSNPDGSCSEKEYKEQCTHNCDPDGESDDPDEAKHNSTNTFYCKESSPGAGDGKQCSEAEHNAQCHKNYVDCSPVVSLPGTCSNISDGSKIEGTTTGVISDINEGDASCSSSSSKPNQIKKCVLGKTDSTSASYEATNEISGNSYCKVYCKEKYNFVLPTAKMTTSGGYFKLNTTVTGTRDCYVASADNSQLPIDETKFNNDLATKRAELIAAWNEYSKWKTIVNIGDISEFKNYHDCSASCSGGTCDETHDTCWSNSCSGDDYYDWDYDWSYPSYNSSGQPTTSSFSQSSKGSCSRRCSKSSCSAKPNNAKSLMNDFKNNRDSALRTLKQKAKELNDIIAMYNSCTGVISNTNYASSLTEATTSSTAQSTWNNDMQFNPVVEFWYNQDYLKNVGDLSNGWAKFTNLTDESDTSKNTYCTGDINDSYECTTGTSSSEPTKSVPILTCREDGCSFVNYNISSAKWITKSKTKEGTYQTSQNFSTYTPYGTIKTDSNGNKYLYTTLPEGSWPISLVTKTGVFPFKFRFSDIGQSNSSTESGRLSDSNESGKNTVVHAYNNLPSGLKCGGESNAYTDGGYVCNYLNNCTDNCDFSCDPNDPTHCTFNTCDNGKCVVTCTNCIFDGNKTTYGYRTVSLNNLFPNGISGRGYNWSGEGISNQKSSDTKKEIEEAGDSIYETPQYSYTLTPSNMKNIRDYNDDAGSFTNSTVPSKYSVKSNINDSSIYCESVSYNGVTYNVNCKSSFLDLIETTGKKFATQNERVTTDNDAFILYTLTNSCLEGSCLKNGIGPSWKLKGSSKQ